MACRIVVDVFSHVQLCRGTGCLTPLSTRWWSHLIDLVVEIAFFVGLLASPVLRSYVDY